MFTGLVEARGAVRQKFAEGPAVRLVIDVSSEMVAEGKIGDSVSINGCCLTVVNISGRSWTFEAGPETLAKTSLGRLSAGDLVNLERSLPAGGRLGGHFVQGHVDGAGEVLAIDRDGEWVTMWFRVAESLAAQMVPKGSIAVDGVSLTLVAVEQDRFSVALIPHTLEVSTLGSRSIGDAVNIETDILGKYVQRFLAVREVGQESGIDHEIHESHKRKSG